MLTVRPFLRAAEVLNTASSASRASSGIVSTLLRWPGSGGSRGRYVEVAENLAAIVSGYADRVHGADGWRRVADQWLQPDARLPDEDAVTCYRLLYSLPGHFNPAMLG